jgi:hypothetical protein
MSEIRREPNGKFRKQEDVYDLQDSDRESFDDRSYSDLDIDPSDIWNHIIDNNLTEEDVYDARED